MRRATECPKDEKSGVALAQLLQEHFTRGPICGNGTASAEIPKSCKNFAASSAWRDASVASAETLMTVTDFQSSSPAFWNASSAPRSQDSHHTRSRHSSHGKDPGTSTTDDGCCEDVFNRAVPFEGFVEAENVRWPSRVRSMSPATARIISSGWPVF